MTFVAVESVSQSVMSALRHWHKSSRVPFQGYISVKQMAECRLNLNTEVYTLFKKNKGVDP